MKLFASVLYALICLGVAGCTVHYIFNFLYRPDNFIEANEWDERSNRNWRFRWASYAYLLPAWFGVGYLMYAGVVGALNWMPRSWIRITENGEVEWITHGIAVLSACMGIGFVLDRLTTIAKYASDGEREARVQSRVHRDQRRTVKKLRVGATVNTSYGDKLIYGTVTKVDSRHGRYFSVHWDEDGPETDLAYFDIEGIKLTRRISP